MLIVLLPINVKHLDSVKMVHSHITATNNNFVNSQFSQHFCFGDIKFSIQLHVITLYDLCDVQELHCIDHESTKRQSVSVPGCINSKLNCEKLQVLGAEMCPFCGRDVAENRKTIKSI